MSKKDIIVFDLETKKSFQEVGGKGREKLGLLGISVLGAYSYNQDKFFVFEESELSQFDDLLKESGLVVGFNIREFDLPVFNPYTSLNLKNLNILDLMDDIVKGVGFRVGLSNLAQASFGAQKSADGLQALRWYKEGKMDEIKKYCLQDVKITKELLEHGKNNGHVLFLSKKTSQKVAIPVLWQEHLNKIDDDVQGVLL
jgi:DEAD/DEAH box helicase domain-containing protein